MITFLLGLVCGWLLLAIGQTALEKDYVKTGIAKINGKYFRITPIDDEINNGGWSDDK